MTIDDFLKEWHSAADYVVGHTSGSTGKPKEIHLLKADMKASAALTNEFFGIGNGSRLMLCLSPDYIAGKMMIVRALEAGATLIHEKPSNRPLEHHDGSPIDLLAVVPSQALWLANHPALLRGVRNIIVGGGEIPNALREKLAMLDVNIYSTYGMTETCSHIALAHVGKEAEPFRALASVTFTTDERGCLVIDAPQFSFRRLTTNDIVRLLSPTSFYWCGRYDNVVNTGGIKVFPEEIERIIQPYISRRFYVTSRPSEKWGQELVLKIEGEPMDIEAQKVLLAEISPLLSPYQLPKAIIFQPHFAETPTGKVKREKAE